MLDIGLPINGIVIYFSTINLIGWMTLMTGSIVDQTLTFICATKLDAVYQFSWISIYERIWTNQWIGVLRAQQKSAERDDNGCFLCSTHRDHEYTWVLSNLYIISCHVTIRGDERRRMMCYVWGKEYEFNVISIEQLFHRSAFSCDIWYDIENTVLLVRIKKLIYKEFYFT